MQHIVGVDIGGTKIHAARIHGDNIEQSDRRLVSSKGTEAQVVEEVIATIEAVFDATVSGIGVGVPSIVDTEKGIVYDVQNIPSWNFVQKHQCYCSPNLCLYDCWIFDEQFQGYG